MRRGDRTADINQPVERRHEAALKKSTLDRRIPRPVRRRRVRGLAEEHADLLPGLADRGAGGACKTRRQRLGAAFDAPCDPVGRVDRAARKDIDAGHKPRRQRPPADQHFEAFAALRATRSARRRRAAGPRVAARFIRRQFPNGCVVHHATMRDSRAGRSSDCGQAGLRRARSIAAIQMPSARRSSSKPYCSGREFSMTALRIVTPLGDTATE